MEDSKAKVRLEVGEGPAMSCRDVGGPCTSCEASRGPTSCGLRWSCQQQRGGMMDLNRAMGRGLMISHRFCLWLCGLPSKDLEFVESTRPCSLCSWVERTDWGYREKYRIKGDAKLN